MPIEQSQEPLPKIEVPQTFGDLYGFMTVTCNGSFNQRRHELIENPEFRELERVLREAMCSPDAKEEKTRLPKHTVLAAKTYLRHLAGKTSLPSLIKTQIGDAIERAKALVAMVMGRKEGAADLQ